MSREFTHRPNEAPLPDPLQFSSSLQHATPAAAPIPASVATLPSGWLALQGEPAFASASGASLPAFARGSSFSQSAVLEPAAPQAPAFAPTAPASLPLTSPPFLESFDQAFSSSIAAKISAARASCS